MYTNHWITQEFVDAPFKDARLDNRLINIANSFYEMPEASIPQACGTRAATEGAYRFLGNDNVKPEAILMPHRERTIERIKEHEIVLSHQDTMVVDYKNHPATKGLGTCATSENALGLLVHTSFATTVDGKPLGILSEQFWTRNPEEYGKSNSRHKRLTVEKESQKWITALDESHKGIPSYVTLVTVCDREADFYDFFHKAVSEDKHLLVRVAQKQRSLENGNSLIKEIESKPIAGTAIASIPRDVENKIKPREAVLAVKYCPVTIKPPLNRKDSKSLPNLQLNAILVEEINPPEGLEPIYWLLITTLPVENIDQAIKKIRWYKQRWKIERYHYVLKSGCKIEELQLESVENLYNALAIYSVIAWKLLWIKLESEQNPDALCDIVLQDCEWQALYCVTNKTPNPPKQPPTLEEAILMISKLGGFLARKCDGKPGVKVIWRGLTRLHDITQGWLTARLPINSQ